MRSLLPFHRRIPLLLRLTFAAIAVYAAFGAGEIAAAEASVAPAYCQGLSRSRALNDLSATVVTLGSGSIGTPQSRILRRAGVVLRRAARRGHGSARREFDAAASPLLRAAKTRYMSRSALRQMGGSFRRLARGPAARCNLPRQNGLSFPRQGAKASVVSTPAFPGQATHLRRSPTARRASGLDRTLCKHVSDPRVNIPKDLVVDACFDGKTLYLTNRGVLPQYVRVSGSVGVPSRVKNVIPTDAPSRIVAWLHKEAEVLPPGYEVAMSVRSGTGAVSMSPAATDILDIYGISKVVLGSGYLPDAVLINDAALMVRMLEGEIATARNCLHGANVLRKVWCSSRFVAAATGSIGTFAASAGIHQLVRAPKKVVQRLWGLLQEGMFITEVGFEVFRPGSSTIAIGAAPGQPPSPVGPEPQTSPQGPGPGQGPAPGQPQPATYAETTGGVTHTWTNYTNAGGYEGPTIPSNATIQISCKVTGFRVADGNTWWYRIASSPWNNAYYASADAFYNNGQTSGSLHGTPFADPNVRNC